MDGSSQLPVPTPVATNTGAKATDSLSLGVRLGSIDIHRGFVMFLMTAELLHLPQIASHYPDSPFWRFIHFHTTHVEWIGCALHDLIQPSFSLLVGVALPFSIMNRRAKGQTAVQMILHASWRALVLVLLGVFLRSVGRSQTNWTLEDTLSQIGLGYVFLFLLGFRPVRDVWIALVVVLIGYWAAFAWYPFPPADFDYAAVGVPAEWLQHHGLTGFAEHWNKNSNFAWAADRVILNWFPRESEFRYNGGGYCTLSFIPTLGTMTLGLLAGKTLVSFRTPRTKLMWLVGVGLGCFVLGYSLHEAGICPIVKRIWTPTWTLYSGGCCLLILAGLFAAIDILHLTHWSFPLRVIGMNSIAIYVLVHLIDGFIEDSFRTHFGRSIFQIGGDTWEPFWTGAATLVVFWTILFWMYRRRIFVRV